MVTTRQRWWAGGLALTLMVGLAACSGPEEQDEVTLVDDTGREAPDVEASDTAETEDAVEDTGGSETAVDGGEDGGADVGACGEDGCPEGTVCDEAEGACRVEVEEDRCGDGASWDGSETVFEEASDSWKLSEMGVKGIRITAVDFDGDGWPDLSVRKGGGKRNGFGQDGDRTFWLLRNVDGKHFEDVTKSSGILARRSGDGARRAEVVAWADVDNDGDMDAYTGFNRDKGEADDTAEIMLNDGDGTFELGPEGHALRRPDKVDAVSGASFVDYNRDGNVDLWVAQYAGGGEPALQDRLYRGHGDGTFTPVNEETGVKSFPWQGAKTLNAGRGHTRAWSGLACDVDDDGTPELMAGSYGRSPNHLWDGTRGEDGSVEYENVSVDSGYAFDDRQDWTDNESARCYCKLNPDAPDCDGVPEPNIPCQNPGDAFRWRHATDREPWRLGGNTGTTVCADIDTDGKMDLLTTEIVHWDVGSSSDPSEILYNRSGDGDIRFERPGNETTGLTRTHQLQAWNKGDITGGIFDFDNDARPDVYIGSTDYPGTRGHLWRQTSDGTFETVPKGPGIDHTSSHGIGLADFDRDGDVDLVAGHSRNRCGSGNHCYPKDEAYVRLFENKIGDQGNWIQVDLAGDTAGTNRAAIGARVEVETERGIQTREVDGGHGHYGIQHEQALHFGLGQACRARVTVRWPDASLTEQSFVLETGRRYRWEQGQVPEPVRGEE